MGCKIFRLDPELASALGGAARFDTLMRMQGEVFRAVADRRTLRFLAAGKAYFIKVHTGVGWREITKNLLHFRLPVLGAMNEYQAILRLTELGVDTMQAAGFGCRGLNPARIESFVVTRELPQTVTLEEFSGDWADSPPHCTLKRAMIERIADTARRMHHNGINHRDFYICHFNLRADTKSAADLKLYLMDLHRAQIRKRTPARWRIKDLAGIHFSSMDLGLTRRDRLRFMRAYRQQPLRQILSVEKALWQRVEKKAARLYARHQKQLKRLNLA